jgi:hypothetical protein
MYHKRRASRALSVVGLAALWRTTVVDFSRSKPEQPFSARLCQSDGQYPVGGGLMSTSGRIIACDSRGAASFM